MLPQLPQSPRPNSPLAGNRRKSDADVSWQGAMKRAIRSQADLRAYLGLPCLAGDQAGAVLEAEAFPTFVPLELADRIKPRSPDDPILRQVLATEQELVAAPGFVDDPVGDLKASAGGGVLHKYQGRALVVTHGACAVHCRYCFRREFPYTETAALQSRWEPALEYLAADASIEEVLLSGGDPLTLTDPVLQQLVDRLGQIPHLRRIRIHTRLPIAIPQRITDGLLECLTETRLSAWVVVHCNCAQEIDDSVAQSLTALRRAGIPVLNQAVLLAGVNDDVRSLRELSLRLVDLGVQPYYLHQLDRVRGSSHFWVDPERGKQLIGELRDQVPGYAVPKFVVEQPGEKCKTPIA